MRNQSGLVPEQVTTDEARDVVWSKQPLCMPWDPALTRKYNTTGHFRLLNQLRSELKAQPILRQETSSGGGTQSRPTPSRTVEVRPQGNRFRRSYQPTASTVDTNRTAEGAQSTSKERLSAIDMR